MIIKRFIPLILAFILLSCSKDEIDLTQDDLMGVWRIESYTFGGHQMELDDCDQRKMVIVTESTFAISSPSIDDHSGECENDFFYHPYTMIGNSIEIDSYGSVKHKASLKSADKLVIETRYQDFVWEYIFRN